MKTANDAIDVARSQIGYTESPPGSNRTKYGEWYRLNGQPWCAIFLSWVLAKAGFNDPLCRGHYTPEWANRFKAAGRWFPRGKGKRGDIAFFDFPDKVYRIQHVALVLKVNSDGTIQTIEGNTSSGPGGSQDNGGGVFRRVRPEAHVVGYGRPRYLRIPVISAAVDKATAKLRRLRRRLALAQKAPM